MDKKAIAQDLKTRERFWLMKTEPGECSIDDVINAPNHQLPWWGIRNYQARNFMRDQMKPGDAVLFYHSSCPKPGIVGLAQIASEAYPDDTQFNPESEYYDPKSSPENPRWCMVNVEGLCKFDVVGIPVLREHPALESMLILRKGNRLSITPVDAADFAYIVDNLI